MNIDEAIEKLTARINCRHALLEDTCDQKCDKCMLCTMQGSYDESKEVDRLALEALLSIKKQKESRDY